MNPIQTAYINALLADASYVERVPVGDITAGLFSPRLTTTQANYLAANFEVISSIESPKTQGMGFDAMVWRGRAGTDYAGQVYISTRGTQGLTDISDDIELALSGVPTSQIVNMVNWWQRIKTPAGQQAQQIQYMPQSGYTLTAPIIGTGEVASVTRITGVNGHSLGGYLATAFTRLFGNQAGVQSVNTFNSAGFSNAAAINISNSYNQIAGLLGLSGSFPAVAPIQTNYYGQNGVNVTTNSLGDARLPGFNQYGSRIALFQEDLLSDPISNHYMYKLTDYLALGAALEKLDPSLSLTKLNEFIKAGSNDMKASYEGVFEALRKALGGPNVERLPTGDVANNAASRETLHATLRAFQDNPLVKDLTGQILLRPSSANLAAVARNDFSALIALQDLSTVWVTGKEAAADAKLKEIWQISRSADYTAWQADKSATSPNTFTDQWIADRAAMLGVLVERNIKDIGGIVPSRQNLRFYDAATDTQILAGAGSNLRTQIVFGDNEPNPLLEGGALADRLYGGAGADTLDGKAGADYLEGGADNDTLRGGDNDQANDTLIGGQGTDTYQFSGLFGNDTITDSDGLGSIEINGQVLGQASSIIKVSDNVWETQDKKYVLTQAGTRLIIGQRSAVGAGTVTNTITLNDWQDGKLGLTLGATAAPNTKPIYLGDQHAPLKTDDKGQQTYDWSITSWAADGSLTGGIAEVDFKDVITGSAGDDLIKGLGGNDALSGGDGDDNIEGGDGNDLIGGGAGSDVLLGGAGADVIYGGNNLRVPNRYGPDDVVTDKTLGVISNPYSGANWVPLGGNVGGQVVYLVGRELTFGSTPAYATVITTDYDTVNAVRFEIAELSNDADVIDGGDGGDVIIAGNGNDVLIGGAGGDLIDGLLGNDLINGGLGNDNLYGDGFDLDNRNAFVSMHGDDVMDGGSGDDKLYGQGGADTLYGGAGDDKLRGDTAELNGLYHGKDTLYGEDGDDHLLGGGDDDILLGGTGKDRIYGDDTSENLSPRFHGNDQLDGGQGDDDIFGGGGQDVLLGGSGDDFLIGEEGSDQLIGGDDNDNLYGDDITLNGSLYRFAFKDHGNDTLDGGNGDDKLVGGAGSDLLIGGSGSDLLAGDGDGVTEFAGDDSLNGGDGNDYLRGDGGNDKLFGDAGNDLLEGGDGDDLLVGGSGYDQLFGGKGDDTYVFDADDVNASDLGTSTLPTEYLHASRIVDDEGNNTLRLNGGNFSIVSNLDPLSTEIVINSGTQSAIAITGGLTGAVKTIQIQGQTISAQKFIGQNLRSTVNLNAEQAGQQLWGGASIDTLGSSKEGVTLHGGWGDDVLKLNGKNTTIVIDSGDGNDTLQGRGDNKYGTEASLVLGADLQLSHVRLHRQRERVVIQPATAAVLDSITGLVLQPARPAYTRVEETLRLVLNESASQYVTLREGAASLDVSNPGIAMIKDAAGQTLSFAQLVARGISVNGVEGDSYLSGTDYKDIFIGGSGNVNISGDEGSDRYEVTAGSVITVSDNEGVNDIRFVGKADLLGMTSQRVTDTNDLRLSFADGTQVLVQNALISALSWTVSAGTQQRALSDEWLNGPGIVVVGSDYSRDVIVGSNQADILSGKGGSGELLGLGGDDFLLGGYSQDVLDGGQGDDTLLGGEGIDTYRFAAGDGIDRIIDVEGRSRFVLGLGLTVQAMQVSADFATGDVTLTWGAAQQVVITQGLERAEFDLEFADGSKLDFHAVIDKLPSNGRTLTGDDTDNFLVGAVGDDVIFARAGKDVLDGRAGNDILQGGDGDDSYLFSLGDGVDKLIDTAGISTLRFAANIDLANIVCTRIEVDSAWFIRVQYALNDAVLVPVEQDFDVLQFVFATGGGLNGAQLLLQTYAAGKNFVGTAADDKVLGWAGNDVMTGGGGRNELVGGRGNDTYIVGAATEVSRIMDTSGSNTLSWLTSDATALRYTRSKNMLMVRNVITGATALIEDFYASSNGWTLSLADGSTQDLRALVAAQAQTVAPLERRELFYSNMLGAMQEWTFAGGIAVKVGVRVVGGDADGNTWDYYVTRDRLVVNSNAATVSLSMQSGVLSDIRTILGYRTKTTTYDVPHVERVVESVTTEPDRIVRVFNPNPTVNANENPLNGNGGDVSTVTGGPYDPYSYVTIKGEVKTKYREIVTIESRTITETVPIYDAKISLAFATQDLRAGDAANTITLSGATALVDAGAGDDVIRREEDTTVNPFAMVAETMSAPGDWLYGADGSDLIVGGSGDDELLGGQGRDYLDGSRGADVYVVDRFDKGWDMVDDSGVELIQVTLKSVYYGQLSEELVNVLRAVAVSSKRVDHSKPYSEYWDQNNYTVENKWFGYDRMEATVEATEDNIRSLMEIDKLVAAAESKDLYGTKSYPHLISARLDELLAKQQDRSITEPLYSFYSNNSSSPNARSKTDNLEKLTWDVVKITGNVVPVDLQISLAQEWVRGASRQVARLDWGDGSVRVVTRDPSDKSGSGVELFEFDNGERLSLAQLLGRVPANQIQIDGVTQAQLTVVALAAFEDAAFQTVVPQSASLQGAVTYKLDAQASLPSWLLFNAVTGELSGLPGQQDVGLYSVAVVATDSAGKSETIELSVLVNPTNDAPVIVGTIDALTVSSGAAFTWAIPVDKFSDVDPGDKLSYSLSLSDDDFLPTWLALNPATGKLTGKAPARFSGSLNIKVTARDLEGARVSQNFVLTVEPSAMGPTEQDDYLVGDEQNNVIAALGGNDEVLAGNGDDTINAGLGNDLLMGEGGNDSYLYSRGDGVDTIIDNQGNNRLIFGYGILQSDLRYSLLGKDLVIDITLDGVVSADRIVLKDWFLPIDQRDGAQRVSQAVFANGTVMVVNEGLLNRAPIAIADALSMTEDGLTADGNVLSNDSDPDAADQLSVSNAGSYQGQYGSLLINANGTYNYTLRGTTASVQSLQAGQSLTDSFSVVVTDNALSGASTASSTLTITILGTNDAPVLTRALVAQAATEIVAFSLVLPSDAFTDVDAGDTLSYAAKLANGNPLPSWLTFNAATRTFSGTPTYEDVTGFFGQPNAAISLRVIATDSRGASAFSDFALTVNQSPELSLIGTSGADNLVGASRNDQLLGGAGNDNLSGMRGDDILDGGTGADQMTGGLGDDRYIVDNAADSVIEQLGQGNDTVYASVDYSLAAHAENLLLTGTAISANGNELNNVIVGNASANLLSAGDGSDLLAGWLGNDRLVGGAGNDTYLYNQGEGRDTITDASGADTVRFGAGITLDSLAAREYTLNGQRRMFVSVLSSSGAEQADQGIDFALDANGASPIEQFMLANGQSFTLDQLRVTARTVNGTTGNDTLTGDRSDDTLVGAKGNDTLYGRTGNDTLYGDAGQDTLFGEAGNDILYGGNDNDWLQGGAGDDLMGGDKGQDTLLGGTGNDTLYGGADADMLDGGQGDDLLGGDAGDDKLWGGDGADTLYGGAGNDLVAGGAGDDLIGTDNGIDVVVAGTGNDTIWTGNDNDFIDAGAGNDTIDADKGNDFIAAGKGNDTITAGQGNDLIAFNRGDGQDTLIAQNQKQDTLSLGAGIRYSDIRLSKSGSDLVVNLGQSDSMTLKDWYLGTNNARKSVTKLQVVTGAAGGDYNASSNNRLLNKQVVAFDFLRLVQRFDQARAANANLLDWAVASGLDAVYLQGSDTQALGGDLSYLYATQYAQNSSYGNLDASSIATRMDSLDANSWQTLSTGSGNTVAVNPWLALQAGTSLIVEQPTGAMPSITTQADLTPEQLAMAALTTQGQIQGTNKPAWV